MRNSLRTGGITLALLAGMSLAAAQAPQQPAAQGQKPPGVSERDHTIPPPGAPTQPKAPLGDLSKPAAVGPDQAQTADQVPEQVPGATPQTMPSTLSAANAAMDDLPILAMQLPLTDEQRKKIIASLSKAPVTPNDTVQASVTQVLPARVVLQEFPDDAAGVGLSRYKYVKLPDRVLIIDPPFGTVVGEIKQ